MDRLRLISHRLYLKWNYEQAGFDLFETTERNGRREQWIMFVDPLMQDNRTIEALRRNNAHNMDTYLELRAHQENARDAYRRGLTNTARENAGYMAEEVGRVCAQPKAGQNGNQTLKDMAAEWESQADEYSPKSD